MINFFKNLFTKKKKEVNSPEFKKILKQNLSDWFIDDDTVISIIKEEKRLVIGTSIYSDIIPLLSNYIRLEGRFDRFVCLSPQKDFALKLYKNLYKDNLSVHLKGSTIKYGDVVISCLPLDEDSLVQYKPDKKFCCFIHHDKGDETPFDFLIRNIFNVSKTIIHTLDYESSIFYRDSVYKRIRLIDESIPTQRYTSPMEKGEFKNAYQ